MLFIIIHVAYKFEVMKFILYEMPSKY
jgi:hypothetical protein